MSQELPADSKTDSHADDSASQPADDQNLQQAISVLQTLAGSVKKQVLGRDDVIDLAVIALIAGGHVLLEDFPGSGKTTLAKALSTMGMRLANIWLRLPHYWVGALQLCSKSEKLLKKIQPQ